MQLLLTTNKSRRSWSHDRVLPIPLIKLTVRDLSNCCWPPIEADDPDHMTRPALKPVINLTIRGLSNCCWPPIEADDPDHMTGSCLYQYKADSKRFIKLLLTTNRSRRSWSHDRVLPIPLIKLTVRDLSNCCWLPIEADDPDHMTRSGLNLW